MADNETRRSQRAASGLSHASRIQYVPPDTVVEGPGRQRLVLRRNTEALPQLTGAFHKYHPGRRGAGRKKGRSKKAPPPPPRIMSAAAAGITTRGSGADGPAGVAGLLQGPMELLGRIPLMHLIVTAALVHRVWSFVSRRFFGGSGAGGGGKAAGGRRGRAGGQRQLTVHGKAGEEQEYDEDDELDERAEELLEQMQHASMLPTMLRASLPRPQRTNLAKREAQKHHSRPRGYRTAHQMMHGGPAPPNSAAAAAGSGGEGIRRKAQRRPMGKLEKMDLIVRQQVRAAMLAQQRLHEQQLQQGLLEGPPGGAPLALPAPAAAPGGAPNQLIVAGGQGAGVRLPLPPPPLPPPAFRPIPPELRARMQGAHKPTAVAQSPAGRAAAAGPPPQPVGVQQGRMEAGVAGSAGGRSGEGEGCGAEGARVSGGVESGAAVVDGAQGAGTGEEEPATVSVPRVSRALRSKSGQV